MNRLMVSGIALLLLALAASGCQSKESLDGPSGAGGSPGAGFHGEDFNVLLISLDTTRADHLGCYGHPESPTPNIDRLAASGVLFEQCVAPTPITLPSHASLMTGVDPFVHGVRYNGAYQLTDDNRTLAETLRDAGYYTGAELAAYVLNREYGLSQGFEVYNDLRQGRTERNAEEVANDAIRQLRDAAASDRPFFLFAHFFDPHHPYEPPEPFLGNYSNGYVGEIAYMDEQVGRLLAELETLGIRDRTLVVVIGDHGESLGEHGEDTHAYFVYDATTAVPLIVSAPGILPENRRVGSQVRLIDVAPSVVGFVGAGRMEGVQGRGILSTQVVEQGEPPLPAYSESMFPRLGFGYSMLRSLRAEGWKYIHAPTPELYRLDDDPAELRNLAQEEPQRVERMREQLRSWIADAPVLEGTDDAQQQMSEEERNKLEALGYLGGSGEDPAVESELELFEPKGLDPKERVEVMALSSRALAMKRAGDLEEAERILTELFRSVPGDDTELAAVHDLYAKVLVGTGRFEEAIEQYRKTLNTGRASGEARTNLGAALLKVGRADEAVAVLEDALRHKPVFASTHVNYGSALLARKQVPEAIVHFRRALEIDPSLLDAYMGLGTALVRSNLRDEAITVYRQAIALYPGAPLPRRSLGELLLGLNRPQEALEQYQALIEITPDDARCVRGLGLSYFQLRQVDQALVHLSRAVELDPNSARAWYSLSGAQAVSGRLDEATASARKALALAQRQGQTDFAGRISKRIREYEEAGGS